MRSTLLSILFLFYFYSSAQDSIPAEPAMPILQQYDKVRDFTLSNDGKEAYFTIQSAAEDISIICRSTKVNGSWSPPKFASFSKVHKDLEPFLSPDGLRLYFVSNRPLDAADTEVKDFDIWYVQRSDMESPWSEAINLGNPVNTEHNEFYPALAENGNLYFTSDHPTAKGRDDIFFSKFIDGAYTEPVSLSENINTEGFEYNSYIAKDESYLLFGGYNRDDGRGSGDIYISHNDGQGNWSKAVPLPAEINSTYMDYCPFVHENSQTLYFTSRRSVAPERPIESMDDFETFMNSYQNGNSRIYMSSFLPIKPEQ